MPPSLDSSDLVVTQTARDSDASTELGATGGGCERRADQRYDARGDAALAVLAASLAPRLGPGAAFAATEHFNLQTARAITVSEANGRATIYLATLSSNLIALVL